AQRCATVMPNAVDSKDGGAAGRQIKVGRSNLEHVREHEIHCALGRVRCDRPEQAHRAASLVASAPPLGSAALPSPGEIVPRATRSAIEASMVCMPNLAPTCMADAAW